MQVSDILANDLSKIIHKSRLNTLTLLVESLFHAKFFSLTGLARSLVTNVQERSAIRRVDRFLGNEHIQKEKFSIYKLISKKIIRNSARPIIIVDWTLIPNQSYYVIRAAMVTSGRALTLYEEVHLLL